MKRKENLVADDEFIAGTEQVKTKDNSGKYEISGYSVKPKFLKKMDAEARHRWENGGKKIYKKLQADPGFALTEDYTNYLLKWEIPIDLPF